MSVATVIEELAVKLGLETEETGFFKAISLAKLVETAFAAVADVGMQLASVFTQLAPDTAKFAEEARKGAQMTGLTTDAFQELSFAAQESGISTNTLQTSLVLMARSAVDAAEGGMNSAFAYRKLGVSVRDANGHIKSTDQLFTELTEKFAEMPDSLEKISLAKRIFGRGGAQLIPELNKGKEGIAALREEAYKYGQVLSSEGIEKSRQYTVAQLNLNKAWEGLKMQLGMALMPGATAFAKWLSDLLIKMRPTVVVMFTEALSKVHSVVGSLAKGLKYLRDTWVSNVAALYTMAGALLAVWAASVLVNSGFQIMTIAMIRAFVVAAAPIVTTIGLLLLAFAILQDIYMFLTNTGETLTGRMFKNLKEDLPGVLTEMKASFVAWAKDTGAAISAALLGSLKESLRDPFGLIKHSEGKDDNALSAGNILDVFNGSMFTDVLSGKLTMPTPSGGLIIQPQQTAHITVTVPAGADPGMIADSVEQGVRSAWANPLDAILNDASAQVAY